MSTDDFHRIRRIMRELNEDQADYGDRRQLELGSLMQQVRREWEIYSAYLNQIQGKSALFTTAAQEGGAAPGRILLNFLIDRRQQIQQYMAAHQDEMTRITQHDHEEADELIEETKGLLKMMRDLKALTFIVADIDNNFHLSPIEGDEENKRQLHQNAWAQASMRELAAKGVPFNMAA